MMPSYQKRKTREAVIEGYLRGRVLALDGLCIKFADAGHRGAPDRLVVLHGKPTYYVEMKRQSDGKLSVPQQRYHERLRARGQRVWVLWSTTDVDDFINEVTLT
jgi:hypothetical protein